MDYIIGLKWSLRSSDALAISEHHSRNAPVDKQAPIEITIAVNIFSYEKEHPYRIESKFLSKNVSEVCYRSIYQKKEPLNFISEN